MTYHIYYSMPEIRVKDIDIPPEKMTDMKAVYKHALEQIAKDPKSGSVVDRGNLVPPENIITITAMERDGVFFGF